MTVVGSIVEFLMIFAGFYILLKIPDFARGVRGIKFLIFCIAAVVIAGLWLSEYLGARNINLIIRWLSLGLCIIYLATFLPEIRRGVFALVAKLSPTESMGLDEKFQNELIEAIYTVSRRGAKGIVILEKTLDVDRYLKDFVKVDAIFSSVLLESLLSHDSPFRGGAIVIKGNRIVMVSEHLPSLESLSHQKDLDHLHLAAIGLTESTDAVVAILPGDGKVSFAWHGKLKQDLFKHELEIRLKEEFGVRK